MTFLRMPDGTVVHVRWSPPRRRRCSVCKLQTTPARLRECDFKLADGKTCDALLCADCAHRVGPNTDWCPGHCDELDDLFDRQDWEPRS